LTILWKVPTRGTKPNTALIATLGEGALNEKTRRVKTLPTLQIPSHPEIFAAGDIIEYPEQKQAGKYPGHSDVIVANMISLMSGKSAVKEYKGTFEGILVTNGKVWELVFVTYINAKCESFSFRTEESLTWASFGDWYLAIGLRGWSSPRIF